MARILFVTHPEVVIDPDVPVPRWPLSAKGRARMEALAEALTGLPVRAVWSSDEQKAMDGAAILSERLRAPHQVDSRLGENDRSATGYIAPPRFWEVVAAFFAHPDDSVLGWETARDAQNRILAAMERVEGEAKPGLTIVVSHGGVGQLLTAALQKVAIGQESKAPNPSGGGYLLLGTSPLRRVGDSWGDIDTITSGPGWAELSAMRL
ncbi:MAG: histidine phosphatase family protein [Phenylobacterium sp.]|uniref:histidine phosphatase family protein n=1 Tax=Phenylobacterium sp. TaxID=1871053 RepID=UPI002718E027|nr:histidine phosphatase family protein [Phenylobacterium sp.]MDO8902537.1 histidine phosphatase family protein [Phenylobacterium sp.]MDP2212768.1 histidine phosphatase family protein [Phenylobacterium sp.]